STMQEHGGEDVGPVEILRHQPVKIDKSIARIIVQREFKKKNKNIEDDYDDRDERPGIARLCIANRKHLALGDGAGSKFRSGAALTPGNEAADFGQRTNSAARAKCSAV